MFHEITPQQISANPFTLLSEEWMLISALDEQTGKYNTMTASWGGFGVLWGKSVAFCVIRPQRYTYELTEKSPTLTLSFYEETYRKALQLCGSKSGRDCDKIALAGLTPNFSEKGTVYFDEARMVFVCRKLYFDEFKKENFVFPEMAQKNYATNDYHRIYICEIEKVLIK